MIFPRFLNLEKSSEFNLRMWCRFLVRDSSIRSMVQILFENFVRKIENPDRTITHEISIRSGSNKNSDQIKSSIKNPD